MLTAVPQTGRILIIDDSFDHNLLLQCTLSKAGHADSRAVTDSSDAMSAFGEFRPDLVLLDLHMRGQDGFEVLRQLSLRIPPQSYLPIMVVTADLSQESKQKALSLGAADFITKPFDNVEVVLRINAALKEHFLHDDLEERNRILDQKVRERTQDLENAQLEVLDRLALAAEYRDDNTGRHTNRVGELAAMLARAVDFSERDAQLIRLAAPLHDLGKIGIPDRILLKPEKLTAEEYELIKTHTVIGARMLSGSKFPVLQLAEKIALCHHERWDGHGYRGLKSEAIPIEARIVSIADTFDVLTHERPYKPGWPVPDAVAEINSQRGRQFDPRLVDAFTELFRSDVLRAFTLRSAEPEARTASDARRGPARAA
jgi:putative two-component system response regulator